MTFFRLRLPLRTTIFRCFCGFHVAAQVSKEVSFYLQWPQAAKEKRKRQSSVTKTSRRRRRCALRAGTAAATTAVPLHQPRTPSKEAARPRKAKWWRKRRRALFFPRDRFSSWSLPSTWNAIWAAQSAPASPVHFSSRRLRWKYGFRTAGINWNGKSQPRATDLLPISLRLESPWWWGNSQPCTKRATCWGDACCPCLCPLCTQAAARLTSASQTPANTSACMTEMYDGLTNPPRQRDTFWWSVAKFQAFKVLSGPDRRPYCSTNRPKTTEE